MSMQEGQWKQLVPRSDGGNYEWRAPRFSPNDQYLAYFNGYDSLDVDRYGLYITNSSSLVSLNTCEQYTKRIFTHATLSFGSSSGFSWSPDSQLLALPFTKRIQVINSNGDALMDIPVNSSFPESISWSPDGNRITYDGDDACIFLMHSQGGESTCLVQEYPHVMLILGWLALPDFVFQTGEKYKITPKGDNINLRTEPSLNAQVLRKIRTKEVVTLLDGPRYEDGYTWWQVQTEDNLIGWAVENSEWYEPVK